MAGIIDVQNEHIGRLGQSEAVGFFRGLLWAEALRLEIAPTIRVSDRINANDGGIDASADNTESPHSDLIKNGYSGYQVKTGTTFNLSESSLKNELFGRGRDAKKEHLGESVRQCLSSNGNFILVCFGLDPTESEYNTAVEKLRSLLRLCGFDNPSVCVWGQSEIKRFVDPFLSLKLQLNQRSAFPFDFFEIWKSHGDMAPEVLSLGEPQEKIIQALRQDLLHNEAAIHLRITGDSGVGKTRIVLESLKDERLNPLVIYTDKPSQLEDQGLLNELAHPDNHIQIIVVLDECDLDTANRYWNKLQGIGKRIRMITIYTEDPSRKSAKNIEITPLGQDEIQKILESYDLPSEHLHRWASFCEGSPRWAKIIGENIKNNAEDILSDPNNVDIVTRYIAGTDNLRDPSVKQRLLVAKFLALFKKFGYKKPVQREADAVFELIKKYDNTISRAHFDEQIKNLRERKILQGETTYYITPKPLHVKLWAQWWEDHSTAFDFDTFSKLPPLLVSGFNQMFRFAQESEAAIRTVEHLLGEDGPFRDGKLLQEKNGASFFLALTEAVPDAAMERLERTVGTWDSSTLLEFRTGRMEVIWAIEMIAVWDNLFDRAVALLVKLVETENDRVYSNNATGVFKDFFSLFSATERSPLSRIRFLKEAVSSKDPRKENAALQAMSIALDTHFTRAIGAEYQGVRREPRLWNPRDNPKETKEYLNSVWDLLVASLEMVTVENRMQAVQTLMHQVQVRGRIPGASDKALSTLREVNKNDILDKNILIEAVVHVLYFGAKELPKETKSLWLDFYNTLVTKDLSSKLNRHVALNLNEDSFTEDGEYTQETRENIIKELAVEAYEKQDELKQNLSWLVTNKAKNGYAFGYELGKGDDSKKLLPAILDARRNSDPSVADQYLIGGYLASVFEQKPKNWERLFEELVNDPSFLPLLPELAWRAGITDKIATCLVSLIENRLIEAKALAFFKFGTSIRSMGEEVFTKWVNLLIDQKKRETSSIAIDIFGRYYIESFPKVLSLKLLTDPVFFAEHDGPADVMDEYIWSKIAEKFLEDFGEDKGSVLKIGKLMLNNLGNHNSIVDHTESHVKAVLARISEMYPDEMWTEALNNIEEQGYFIFKHWLSSNDFLHGDDIVNDSIIQKIKLETLWKWIDEDMEKRAWFIANLVPKSFSNDGKTPCLAREVLKRYGNREDVRRNLAANFFTEGWSGKASDHYEHRLKEIQQKRAMETEPLVTGWMDEYIVQLKDSIQRAKIQEEREDW